SAGFGYDPIFEPRSEAPGGRTLGEGSAEEKNAISHRGEGAPRRYALPRRRPRARGPAGSRGSCAARGSEPMPVLRSICVFCGASAGRDPRYAAAAAAVGTELARRGTELVYGGGRLGLMGVVADAALAAGGRVTGVIPTG